MIVAIGHQGNDFQGAKSNQRAAEVCADGHVASPTKKNKVLKNIEMLLLRNSNVLYWYSGLKAFNVEHCIRVRFPANAHLCVGWLFFYFVFFQGFNSHRRYFSRVQFP